MLTFYSTLKLWDFSKSKVSRTEQVVSNSVILFEYIYFTHTTQ